MIQNKLFRDCLAAIPAEQKAEFDLSFGIAERISEILKAKGLTQKDFAQFGEGFDAPPTLERSGSEHRRVVTSPLPEEEGLGEKVELLLAKGRQRVSKVHTLQSPHNKPAV